jgi:hypothetical protein
MKPVSARFRAETSVREAGLADPGLMGLKYLAVMPDTKENPE